jgi:hypothetical protein
MWRSEPSSELRLFSAVVAVKNKEGRKNSRKKPQCPRYTPAGE